jgi:LysM domain
MILKHNFSARSIIASGASLVCAAALLALGACSSTRHGAGEQPTAPESPPSEGAPAPAAQAQTVTEALDSAPADSATETATVIPDAGAMLRSGAPRNYVVRRGDTLWGIANMFLRDPWLWPEIWYVNPQIQNPHLIYPGDSVHLALAQDGRTELQIVRGSASSAARLEPLLRSRPLESAIANIPYTVIAAFLDRPGVLSMGEVKTAPYIMALRGEHDVAGSGDEIYVKKLDGETGAHYSVMHVDEPLRDPDSGRRLGYLAIYTGTAQLTRPGSIAKAMLTQTARETLQGDVLVPEEGLVTSDFMPHPPARPVSGLIIAVVAGEDLAGQYDVVALNRGARDGLDRGTVLTADEIQAKSDDQCARIEEHSTCLFHPSRSLPSEPNGTLLVFKTYPYMSYALILSDAAPVHVNDRVRNP